MTDPFIITQETLTPRFIEACRREGIPSFELFPKTRDQIVSLIKSRDPTGG